MTVLRTALLTVTKTETCVLQTMWERRLWLKVLALNRRFFILGVVNTPLALAVPGLYGVSRGVKMVRTITMMMTVRFMSVTPP